MLLQHRTNDKEKIEVLFATSDPTSPWQPRHILITVGEDRMAAESAVSNMVASQPNHRQVRVLKSSMRTKSASTMSTAHTKQALMETSPALSIRACSAASTTTVTTQVIGTTTAPKVKLVTKTNIHDYVTTTEQITDLCESLLNAPSNGCVGFLRDGAEDCKYYLYLQPKQLPPKYQSISLEGIFGEKYGPPLSFKQSLFLAMTLASSFVQLLESPWIPYYWTKADIVFFPDPEDPNAFLLDKPYVSGGQPHNAEEEGTTLPRDLTREEKRQESLSQLGIVLEELCFRSSIEKHPLHPKRRDLPTPRTRRERLAFDVMTALSWLCEIKEEAAGLEYEGAVKWCLVDNRISPGGSDSWRKEMLGHVVGPLERCYKGLTTRG